MYTQCVYWVVAGNWVCFVGRCDQDGNVLKKERIGLADNLQTLIKELETEKENLLRLIDEAVKEQEFLYAHFHFEALAQINGRLQTLKNLDDELYDKKYFLGVGIDNLRKRLETETSNRLKSMIGRQIADKERELVDLNQRPRQTTVKNDSSLIRNYLDLFGKKKLRGLRIVISKPDNLRVEIRRTSDGVKLTIPNIKKLEKEYMLFDERLAKLKGLGFVLNNNKEKLIMRLQHEKNGLTKKIETVLSIIVFEVFYFKELGKDASIEVIDKRTGKNDSQSG